MTTCTLNANDSARPDSISGLAKFMYEALVSPSRFRRPQRRPLPRADFDSAFDDDTDEAGLSAGILMI